MWKACSIVRNTFHYEMFIFLASRSIRRNAEHYNWHVSQVVHNVIISSAMPFNAVRHPWVKKLTLLNWTVKFCITWVFTFLWSAVDHMSRCWSMPNFIQNWQYTVLDLFKLWIYFFVVKKNCCNSKECGKLAV